MRNIECSLGEGKINREASPKKFASFSCITKVRTLISSKHGVDVVVFSVKEKDYEAPVI